MSLGLPDFSSRGAAAGGGGLWRVLQFLGLAALGHAFVVAGFEGQAAWSADRSLARARAEGAQVRKAADETRRSLEKRPDFLVATASIESSPERVLNDLQEVLPQGVSIASLNLDYLPDASTRLLLNVVARTPEAYDRFLNALTKSKHFAEIKPGAESRPGPVRAAVTATHHPERGAR